jgi:putative ABC transport system ATP-binding protein
VDPLAGPGLLARVDVRDVSFARCRRRVVMVPQEGFLFDASLARTCATGATTPTDAGVAGGRSRTSAWPTGTHR